MNANKILAIQLKYYNSNILLFFGINKFLSKSNVKELFIIKDNKSNKFSVAFNLIKVIMNYKFNSIGKEEIFRENKILKIEFFKRLKIFLMGENRIVKIMLSDI